jgi:hypothetical protein
MLEQKCSKELKDGLPVSQTLMVRHGLTEEVEERAILVMKDHEMIKGIERWLTGFTDAALLKRSRKGWL